MSPEPTMKVKTSKTSNYETIQETFEDLRAQQPPEPTEPVVFLEAHNQDINVKHLNALWVLRNEYHEVYLNLSKIGRRSRQMVDDCLSIYVPNVLNSFPILLDTIDTLRKRIKHLEAENVKLYEERKNAYKALGWPIATRELNFHDTAPVNKDAVFEQYQNRKKRGNKEPQQESG